MKKISLILVSIMLLALIALPALSAAGDPPLLVDKAGILTDYQRETLEEKLNEISERHQCNVSVIILNGGVTGAITPFTDDYFDHNGYGYGSTNDGVMLLVDMESRQWCTSTAGTGWDALNDDALYQIEGYVEYYLSEGNYSKAFSIYAEMVDSYLSGNGDYYDSDVNRNTEPTPVMGLVSAGLGVATGFGVVGSMKSKLKSVRTQYAANNYANRDSMTVYRAEDTFLYRNVSRTRRATESSGGSGGHSSHTSSSGVSHGGHSGHF